MEITKNSPTNKVATQTRSFLPFRNSQHATRHYPLCSSPFFSDYSTLFCVFLRLPETQPFYFHAIPNSLGKTPGVWVGAGLRTAEHKAFPAFPLLSTFNFRSKIPT